MQDKDSKYNRIGSGALWIKEGRNGKFMSGEVTFPWNGSPITARMIIFRNHRKEGKQPDFNIFVDDAFPAKAREVKEQPREETENQIPF